MLTWIKWNDGAAVAYQTKAGRCDWAYCGGGPSFRDVSPQHFVAAIESLLGWQHPAADKARAFVKAIAS
jgi:hypothetical protein